MSIKEIEMEMRGMKSMDIVTYFSELEDVGVSEHLYMGKDWSVKVGDEVNIRLGALVLPTTKVIFFGEEKVLEKVIYKFRLRFLSAGG